MQYKALGDTFYFNFAVNNASGSGSSSGTTPVAYVRLKGATASVAPVYTATPYNLTNSSYPSGCYEVSIPATTANGFVTDSEYAVFSTIAISEVNPTGFIGEFITTAMIATNTDGSIDANITALLGTTITETATGYLAAAFIKLFDVASPVLTCADGGIKKGTALTYFPFRMTSDGVTGLTGLTVTAYVKQDSGSFSAASGTVTEIGNGNYILSGLTASEMNGTFITLRFIASGAKDTVLTIVTNA